MRIARLIPFLSCVLILARPLALSAAPVQISTDPYANPDSQHQTQVEPDTFAYGTTVVAAFQSGRFFDGGCSNIGWATSPDGGTTWTNGFLPALTVNSTPAGAFPRVSDPSVAYDAKHDAWFIASLAFGGSTEAILASRSTDGGLTWNAPVAVSSTDVDSYDKNWIVCDNNAASRFYGNCYVTWDDTSFGNQILMSTSSDGGLTWSPGFGPRQAFGLGGQPVVQPRGQVIVPASDAFGSTIIWFRSRNGGRRWSRARKLADVLSATPAGGLRESNSLPSAEVDGAGKVYVVWSDCRFRAGCSSNDIVLSTTSTGARWSAPVRIPIDPVTSSVDHFIPGLAVDPTTSGSSARLALTYYYYPNASCSVGTCQLYVGFIASSDGGLTWTAAQTLAGPMSLSWLPNTSLGYMVGDYISTSFVGPNAVPVFANAGAPSGSVLQEATFADMLGVGSRLASPRQPTSVRSGVDPQVVFAADHPAPTALLTAR